MIKQFRSGFQKVKLGLGLAVLVALTGCQSKNPLDYLPQTSGGYMGMNMIKMRESAGLKRLNEELSKFQQGASDLDSDRAQRVYMAFDSISGQDVPYYGVAIGTKGFAQEVVGKFEEHGAVKGKMSSRDVYTSGSTIISPVGDTGILFFEDEGKLNRMINVSKKKEAHARQSPEFMHVMGQLNNNALGMATKAQPLLDMANPFLVQYEGMYKPGIDALRQVSMLSFAFNWDEQPVIELKLHLNDKAVADTLAGTLNGFLTMAKNMPMPDPRITQVMQNLQATSAEDGVTIRIEIPAEIANQLFDQMGEMQRMQQQQQQLMQGQQQMQYQGMGQQQ